MRLLTTIFSVLWLFFSCGCTDTKANTPLAKRQPSPDSVKSVDSAEPAAITQFRRQKAQCDENGGYGFAGLSLGNPYCPATGDSIPKTRTFHPDCPVESDETVKWLAIDPHVPFLFTRKKHIVAPENSCCAPWAVQKSQWQSVDQWGQVTGRYRLSGGEGYDVTKCFELDFKQVSGNAGIGLLFQGSKYNGSPNFSWHPESAQLQRLKDSLSQTIQLVLPGATDGESSEAATQKAFQNTITFFMESPFEDKNPDNRSYWAVSGGPFLSIWTFEQDQWLLYQLFNTNIQEMLSSPSFPVYTPRAIFDINGDGVPNIVVHENTMAFWWDTLLQFTNQHWSIVAVSVAGSTA